MRHAYILRQPHVPGNGKPMNNQSTLQTIRRLIDENGNLTTPARDLAPNADLYRTGLTPFMAIRLMLARRIPPADAQSPKHVVDRRDRRLHCRAGAAASPAQGRLSQAARLEFTSDGTDCRKKRVCRNETDFYGDPGVLGLGARWRCPVAFRSRIARRNGSVFDLQCRIFLVCMVALS